MARKRSSGEFPPLDKTRVLEALAKQPQASKRDLARVLRVKGSERIALKRILKELETENAITRSARRRYAPAGNIAEVTVLEIVGQDPDGELLGTAAALGARRDTSENCDRTRPKRGSRTRPWDRRARTRAAVQCRRRLRGARHQAHRCSRPSRARSLSRTCGPRPHRADRPQDAPRICRGEPRQGRRGFKRIGARRAAGRPAFRAAPGARGRASRQHERAARDQPDRHPRARNSHGISARGASRGRACRIAAFRGAHRPSRYSRWSPSIRKTRAITTMRCGPDPTRFCEQGRPYRRSSPSPMSPITSGPVPRSTAKRWQARQLRLFPRPCRADAARAPIGRSVLAARRRRAPLSRGAHGIRRERTETPARIPARCHAFGGAPDLCRSAARVRRCTRSQSQRRRLPHPCAAVERLSRAGGRARSPCARSISICPSVASVSVPTDALPPSHFASVSNRCGSSRR